MSSAERGAVLPSLAHPAPPARVLRATAGEQHRRREIGLGPVAHEVVAPVRHGAHDPLGLDNADDTACARSTGAVPAEPEGTVGLRQHRRHHGGSRPSPASGHGSGRRRRACGHGAPASRRSPQPRRASPAREPKVSAAARMAEPRISPERPPSSISVPTGGSAVSSASSIGGSSAPKAISAPRQHEGQQQYAHAGHVPSCPGAEPGRSSESGCFPGPG